MTATRQLKTKELTPLRAVLIKKQSGVCDICLIPISMESAMVDHDHRSGLVRGALCRNCNGIEGKVFNLANRAKRTMRTKDWLGRLILYWIKHETNPTELLHPTHKTEDEKRIATNKKARVRRAKAKVT